MFKGFDVATQAFTFYGSKNLFIISDFLTVYGHIGHFYCPATALGS